MSQVNEITQELKHAGTTDRAKASQRYFKTGPGEYGEGDVFVGVTMPQQRLIANKHLDLTLGQIQSLLNSKIHEMRMIGLLILTYQFPKTSNQEQIFNFYLKNSPRINNWDLVDVSAPKIVGSYLYDKNRNILLKLAKSKLLWDRRIAIISTAAFIDNRESEWTFRIAAILLNDKEDLIHKAVGWMLREVGKNCGEEVLRKFLNEHAKTMPRTMLRYAIEKFDPKTRGKYLKT